MWDKPFKLTKFERERIKIEIQSYKNYSDSLNVNGFSFSQDYINHEIANRLNTTINNIERLIAQDTEQADESPS